METTRNENGSRPTRIRGDYHASSLTRPISGHASSFWTLRASTSRLSAFCAFPFSRFQGLMLAGANEMFVHHVAGLLGITGTDCLIDTAVEFCGFSQVSI